MKNIFPLSLALMITITTTSRAQAPQPLEVVPTVDLLRYAGRWFEIARLPNRFQDQCAGDVTATYTLLDNGNIKVVNRCRNESGEFEEVEGLAKLADESAPNSKLKVRFAPAFLSFLPFVWGDYWIIILSPEYSYAVIGEPARKYLWILSRTPAMDATQLEDVLHRVKEKGYDIGNLIMTNQSEATR
ncbi:MAG: lipocalin family protein [Bacteroidota bacterium]